MSLVSQCRRILPAAGILVSCTSSDSPPGGTWIGQAGQADSLARIEVTLDSAAGTARITLARWGLDTVPATRLSRADSLTFIAMTGTDSVRLTGIPSGEAWLGSIALGARRAPLEMVRVFPLEEEAQRALIGSYRSEDGHLIAIAPFHEFGTRPMLVDFRTGRMGPLYPLSRDRLLVGETLIAAVLPGDSLTLTRSASGAVEQLRYIERGKEAVIATRVETRDTAVSFRNDSVNLAGTLVLPAGPPPWPAMVLLHGSNAQTRDMLGPWARFFAAQGFATLAYDKRGTGQSTGDWQAADFEVLAGDALSAVEYLKTRPDIRRDRIGLWGISQAGWLLPIVAAKAPEDIAFMVVHAGTGTTARVQGVLNLRSELRAAGLSPASIEIGLAYQRLDDVVTSTGTGWPELQKFYQEHSKTESWLWEPRAPDNKFRAYYRMLMDFDPVPYWRRVRCPVLLFHGELDANVPPNESWPPIARALREGGNRQVTQVVLPGANHVFLAAKTGGRDEYPYLSRFVPGYFDRMAEWLAVRKE